jgi:hypothetical protein
VKSAAGKTMMVATTFTGAVACAAAFMPSTAHAATQNKLMLDGETRTARPDLKYNSGCEPEPRTASHDCHFPPRESMFRLEQDQLNENRLSHQCILRRTPPR